MPKAKAKGGKNRRRGKNESDEKRELIFKEDGQEYAQVLRMLGNGRLEAQCIDGVKRLCHIRGKMRKKVWVNTSDIILLGLRDFQDEKDITNFISNVVDKNYAAANKDLTAVVEAKLKERIAKANKKNLF